MLTADQLDHWFTYHQPTEEQKPKYAAIRDAEQAAMRISWADASSHDEVNAVLRLFVEIIDLYAPDSADKTAAIRCVRIARNAINEALVLFKARDAADPFRRDVNEEDVRMCVSVARMNLRMARWQASAAIALEGR